MGILERIKEIELEVRMHCLLFQKYIENDIIRLMGL